MPRIDTSSLPDSKPRKVTGTRAAFATGCLSMGVFCGVSILLIGSVPPVMVMSMLSAAGVLILIGAYAMATYVRHRLRDERSASQYLALFAHDNDFRSPASNMRQRVHDVLGSTRYIHGLQKSPSSWLFPFQSHQRDTRPMINFSVEGTFAGSSFALVGFDAVRPSVSRYGHKNMILHKGALIITPPHRLEPHVVAHIRRAILNTSPFAQAVILGESTLTVVFTDGIAVHKAAMRHYFRLIQYIADHS